MSDVLLQHRNSDLSGTAIFLEEKIQKTAMYKLINAQT